MYALLIVWSAPPRGAAAAALPPAFSESAIATGLENPTAMQFAPDGRLFICEQAGRLRVVKNGVLLPAPFVQLTVDATGERGLLGVAFDPGFAANHLLYVYYTATTPTVHNRISRFTANGDVAAVGSELTIFELDDLGASNHNGGALAFGPDGKLYAGVGENAVPSNAQTLSNVLGKMLRINTDGTIPADNPFFNSASGRNRAIWALGLRNPFTFAFNPGGTELFINDVGQSSFEEIDDGRAGANYGWPATEGPTADPSFVSPRFAYDHSQGCAITGGAFYSPPTVQFPADYVGDYFFSDLCGGWIRKIDPSAGNALVEFATGISLPVDLKVGADGSLYYLARGAGATTGGVFRIDYVGATSAFSLSAAVPFGTGVFPSSVSIGDLNGDGHPDLATPNAGSDSVSIFFGNGSGGFGPRTDIDVGAGAIPHGLAISDLNGDGHLDMAVANTGANTVTILLGSASGTFTSSTVATGVAPFYIKVADLDGDAIPDLAVVNVSADTLAAPSSVAVHRGLGDGTFAPRTDFPTGLGARSVAIGDLNGDGRPDLVVANANASVVSVLLGTGGGNFAASVDYPAGAGTRYAAVADVNGDGRLDVVTANATANTVSVLLGAGDGTLGAQTDFAVGLSPRHLAVSDIDGDGHPDLIVADLASNAISVLIGNGHGGFAPKMDFASPGAPFFVAVDDLTSDGLPDIVVANVGANTLSVVVNTTPISVTPSPQEFGNVVTGSVLDRTFTVTNTGGGTLMGAATTSAPFSIVGGGSYSLAPGASQLVTVRFSPTTVASAARDVQFTFGASSVSRVAAGVGSNPVPAITTPSPATLAGGGAAFTLTVNGSNFVSASVVRWDGANRATTFVSSGQLQALIPASDIAAPGSVGVTVSNPLPGGGASNAVSFTITPVPPSITTQPVSQIVASGTAAQFTAAASGVPAPAIRWQISTDGGSSFIDLTNTAPYSGTTTAMLTVTNATVPLSGNQYRAVMTNVAGSAATAAATLTVIIPPTITTTSPWPTAAAGSSYALTLQATGGVTPYTWSVGGGTALPSGLAIDGTTGAISGTPNAAGIFSFNIRVACANTLAAEMSFSLTVTAATDPLLDQQWHLKDSSVEFASANVQPVWATTRGAGVVIGIVDDGLQTTHPELQANYLAALSHDFNGGGADPSPVTSGTCATTANCRGTSVAGLAAARSDNGLGGSGVAPLASLAGLRLTAAPAADADEAAAFTHQLQAIDIENNSWGRSDDGSTLAGPGPLAQAALETATTQGRGGKGRIFVFAAGDGRANADNCNANGYANSRFVIAVGAVDDTGQQTSYSESCSALLVSAPSSGAPGAARGITTTDLVGVNGADPTDYTSTFGQTAAAAPIVSGIAALMLARNPALTWRDVQHIFVRSSRQVNASDPGWTAGAFPHSERYGFGLVDAAAAVNLAATWTHVAAESTLSAARSVGLSIPDNPAAGVSDDIVIGADQAGFTVEHVEVEFTATHPRRGDLEVTLTSPAGRVSHLATMRPADASANFTAWRFRSVRHWGESAAGTWTLQVADRATGVTGTFDSWTLRIYGVALPPPPPPAPAAEPAPPAPAPPPAAPEPEPAPSTPPGAPSALVASVVGSTVILSWHAPVSGSTPTSYVLEAGSAPGATDVVVFSTGSADTSYTAVGVALGTYFVRVRAANAFGTGPPSNEVVATIVSAPSPTAGAPLPPIGLTASSIGSSVTLTWNRSPAGGAPAFYVVEAGSASGRSDLATFSTGSAVPSFSASGVGAGTYFVRVRAGNALGFSEPSNEAVLVVGAGAPGPCAGPPGAPSGLQSSVIGSTVTMFWIAAAGAPTSYVLEAGSFPGGTNVTVSDTGTDATSLTASGVGAGTYFVRVRARNACGAGAASNEATVVVR